MGVRAEGSDPQHVTTRFLSAAHECLRSGARAALSARLKRECAKTITLAPPAMASLRRRVRAPLEEMCVRFVPGEGEMRVRFVWGREMRVRFVPEGGGGGGGGGGGRLAERPRR